MSETPYLYDDAPETPFTGTPRRRRALLTGLLVGVLAVVAIAVILLPLLGNSAAGKAKEVTGVFLKALAARDTETAYGLLCDAQRQKLEPGQVAGTFLGATPGTVGNAAEVKSGGTTTETVDVHWADGSTSRYTLVNESGPRICATHPVG